MNTQKSRHGLSWRTAASGVIGLSLLAIASTGVLAGLNATTSSVPQTVAAGTLRLTMAATTGSAGFGQSISNLAPGDVVNRYVTLTNSGTLDSQGLTLTVASSGTQTLITDGVLPATTKALKVTVQSCSVAWTQTTGLCAGVAGKSEIAATTLSSFASAQALTTNTLIPAGGLNLQIQTALPDQFETTVDGNLPLPGNTVQGGSVNLTYTFFETQRTATSTNS